MASKAVVLSEHDLDTWVMRYRRGDVSTRLPYGAEHLETYGFELAGARQMTARPMTRLRNAIEHRVGMPIERTVRAVPKVFKADLVLALLEQQGRLPGMLKSWKIPPFRSTPLVILSCWLAEVITTSSPQEIARIKRQLEPVDLVLYLSSNQGEIFANIGIPEERLAYIPFGVGTDYFVPDAAVTRDIPILAVGQDRGRDYATLFEAVRGTDLEVHLICKSVNLDGLVVPPNVHIRKPVPLRTYRDLLRRAQIVVVPTRQLAYPTGSSVALEAAASGCAVAVTSTPAMQDYFTDDTTAALVGVGDVLAWRETLHRLRASEQVRDRLAREGRRRVLDRFSTESMWFEVARAIRRRGLVEQNTSRR